MIIKSMSRKEPSFEQLISYMSSEKADARYDLHWNCFSRDHDDLVAEFEENARLLSRRKNGNYLYHEILSLEVAEGADPQMYKERLRDIAERYVSERSPHNLAYGCLHEDHAHNLHYHLLISANERGERCRYRLPKRKFDTLKRELEAHVLKQYPELKQRALIGAVSSKEKMSVKAGEMQRRSGALPERESVKTVLQEAMAQTSSMHNFCFFLSEHGLEFYTRGKNFGVQATHESGKTRKYRFSTLGVHEDFEAFQLRVTQMEDVAKPKQQSSEDLKADVEAQKNDETASSSSSPYRDEDNNEVKNSASSEEMEREAQVKKLAEEFREQSGQKKGGQSSGQKDPS